MRKFANLLALAVLAAPAWAQPSDTPAAPQTARQALIEMLFSKTPGTLIKHLPAATLDALEKSGGLATLQQYSALAAQFHTTGKTFETFETGSVLLTAEDAQTSHKFEITVANDSLRGDEDDIEVAFQSYKDKLPQRTGLTTRMTFGMKMESGIWKLNEILFTVRVPLADPDFLRSITEAVKARTAATVPMQPQGQTFPAMLGPDSSVLAAMRTIVAAEETYSAAYPSVGYTCTLSDLDGFGGGQPNEHQAMLIPSGLASGKKYGYVFTLSGCAGTPASSFHLAAAPGRNGIGRRAFCSDQSGAIRSSADGNPATCLTSGIPAR